MFATVVLDILGVAALLLGIATGVHALLNKRDPRSQLMWALVSVGVPVLGAALYWVLGVNRIRTRARKWREGGRFEASRDLDYYEQNQVLLSSLHPAEADSMLLLLQVSSRVTGWPLLGGNQVEALFNGEEAYPAMLEAIEGAERYIFLCSYLFQTDAAGQRFVDALLRAGRRGVRVHVLLDAIGEKYGKPNVGNFLEDEPGILLARFLPLSISLRGLRVNLRNHRKIMVVDGKVGFTGGMNIGQRHMLADPSNRMATADIHFRMCGPIVHALEEVFCEDWYFTTGDDIWQPGDRRFDGKGTALCRAIKDGPNEDFEVLQWILVGGITCARTSVKILTPYFIPSRELLAALKTAVLRGAEVELILPARSNLRFVDWATNAMLLEVLEMGVKVYHQPAPFDHSKLLIIDDFYLNVGSANLDPRSLRLNFEFNVEVYDLELADKLAAHFATRKARSTPVTREWLDRRSFAARLRDATAKVFSPYL